MRFNAPKLDELRSQLAEVREKRDRQITERGNLIARQQANPEPDAGLDERLTNTNRAIERLDEHARELEAEYGRATEQHERIARSAGNPRATEGGSTEFRTAASQHRDASPLGEARDAALRAIERYADTLGATSSDMLDRLTRRDRDGLDSRYLAAVADEHYERAFARVLGRPETAQFEMTPQEGEALRRVAEITAQRAMAVGTPSAGGYGVPLTIDPTIMLTSDGAVNPLREVARVRQITTSEWRGVSSAGVTAAFGAEGAEVADGTPTLAQPTIIPERASAFVPFSIEAGMDYPSLAEELGRLFADAKDNLEATKYVSGAGHGSKEPQGIVTAATGTIAAGTAAYAVAHLYTLQEALPPRFQPRARFLSSLAIKNRTRQFDTGDAGKLLSDDESKILGKPWHEASTMAGGLTAGNRILLYGDIAAGFEIVDRIGMSVELIPHLMGASGRPTGQRGLFAWWRTSSGIVNQSALRVLVTT